MAHAKYASGELREFLEKLAIPYQTEHPLHTYTTFRLGGPADFFVAPEQPEQMAALQDWISLHEVPVFVLGGGSNLLISDSGFRGVVVHPQFGEEPKILHQSADRLSVFVPASARAPLTGKKLSALGFEGLEFLTTIPGHFGGSIIQNAGCYGHELKDSLVSVEAVSRGNVQTLKKAECEFSYRSSAFKTNAAIWVAGATLELARGDSARIEEKMTDYKNRRIASQPKNRRSAGSIFKNPRKEISQQKSWQLIEAAGLRGVREGDAEISAEHCNFIVNNGAAKAADVYKLMRLIETRVLEKTGIRLEREIVPVGDFSAADQ